MQINQSTLSVSKQQGAVLVMSLVLMAILAIIGITSMRGNITDVKIHKAMKSRSIAFQCAEAALRSGESWIDNLARAPVTKESPTKASYEFWPAYTATLKNMEIKDTSWWETNGWTFGNSLIDSNNLIGCNTEPYYIIQHIGYVAADDNIEFGKKSYVDYFRITSRSVGINSSAAVVLQTTYGKRLR